MGDFEKTVCLVCNSNNCLPYSTKGQFGIPTNVVICRDCGFSYLNPRWTKERYHTFYTKEYDTYYRPEVISKNYKYDSAKSIKDIIVRGEGIVDFKKEGLSEDERKDAERIMEGKETHSYKKLQTLLSSK